MRIGGLVLLWLCNSSLKRCKGRLSGRVKFDGEALCSVRSRRGGTSGKSKSPMTCYLLRLGGTRVPTSIVSELSQRPILSSRPRLWYCDTWEVKGSEERARYTDRTTQDFEDRLEYMPTDEAVKNGKFGFSKSLEAARREDFDGLPLV